MQNYADSIKKSSPPGAARWQPVRVRLFPHPALTRRDRLEQKPAGLLSDSDRAFMEAFDLASAFPGCLDDIYAGIAAALKEQYQRSSS